MLARRARLRSHKPLRRKTKLRARRILPLSSPQARLKKRKSPRRRPPEYVDEQYLAYLRSRPCRVTWSTLHPNWHGRQGCDPHHARHDEHGRSLGANMKDDRRAISLCRICHGCIDELSGPFKGWARGRVHEWVDAQIADQRAQFLALSMVTDALAQIPVGKTRGGDNYQDESHES